MQKELWLKILDLKSVIDAYDEQIEFCLIAKTGEILINNTPNNNTPNNNTPNNNSFETEIIIGYNEKYIPIIPNAAVLLLRNLLKVDIFISGNLAFKSLEFLQIYLPYCFFKKQAKLHERAILTAHFAQTLDGKIATASGHSKWIGNEENLLHAHRMRALSDGILVGSGTITRDRPSLNVRLVEGKSPCRIILGNSCTDFSSLQSACSDKIIVIGKIPCVYPPKIEYYELPATDGFIDTQDILRFLFSKGIYSIYLEGGPLTTSTFLKDKAVDVLQLHLAPMLFGSGKQAITLPQIAQVKDGMQFSDIDFWKMGDAVMFAGRLTVENK